MKKTKENVQVQRKTNNTIMLSNKDTKSFAVTRFKGITVLALFLIMTVTAPLQVIYAVQDNDRSLSALAQQIVVDRSDEVMTISLEINEMKLSDALELLTSEMGVGLSYSSDTPLDKTVTLQLNEVPFHEALYALLEGTNLEPLLPPTKDVLVIGAKEENNEIEILQETIRGQVVDAQTGEPLPSVNILIQGTSTGTTTDVEGNFELTVSNLQETLIISYIGYERNEVALNGRSELNIELMPTVLAGEELLVIGYGTVRSEDLTGSISQISTEDVEAVPVFDLQRSLKGRAAGVQVMQNSGEPGGNISVRIRGDNSIIGNNEPLYVVDGFPVTGGIDYINPSDIESMNILKDASATAIYGSRGANGVVMITTKQGERATQGRIQVHSSYGVQQEMNGYEFLNASQWATVANEWLRNEGLEPHFSQSEIESLGEGTDWWGEFINPAPIQNHSLSFSGGSEFTSYSMSFNYYDQEGIVYNTSARRGNLRLNLDHTVNEKVNVGLNLIIGRNERNRVHLDNVNWGDGLLGAPPTLPVYDENGEPYHLHTAYHFSFSSLVNPAVYEPPYKNRSLGNSITGNTTLEYSITDALVFETRAGLEYNNSHTERFAPSYRVYREGNEPHDGYVADFRSYSNSILSENTLNYLQIFDDRHRFDIVGGVTYQNYTSNSVGIEGNQLATNITENYNLSVANLIRTPSSGTTEWTLLSGLARVNYTFDDKYIATASIRRDGSSRFGAANKWGNFPSGALAWIVSNEEFMANADFINHLKLRASYGVTGSTALNPYQSLNRLGNVQVILGGTTENIGFVPNNVPNPNLKWEKTTQMDVGFDLRVLEDRLNISLDYYSKITSDLLASVPLPLSTGFDDVLRNIGKIENKGLELTIGANVFQQGFRWDIDAQVSTNDNTLLELAGGDDIIGPSFGHPYNAPLNIMREGEAYGTFYGLLIDGLDEEGYYKYKDTNNDGTVNSQDRVLIGDPNPDYLFSMNNTFSYRNFSLNIFLEGSQGNDVFWATSGVHLGSFQWGHNQFADFWGNYWTDDNPDPNAKYQKVSSASDLQTSDRDVHDGSYIRLKSMTLTYNIPVTIFPWLDSSQVYVSGTNLLTLTNYPGLDPEVSTRGFGIFRGVEQNAYPSPRIISIGTRLNF